jgi:hypothetical protein
MKAHVGMMALLSAGLMAASASAAVVTVSGGDAGQGLTLNPALVVYAFDVADNASRTVQGVTFTTTNANIVVNGSHTSYTPGDPFSGSETSSNDTALKSVVTSGIFYDSAPTGGITISGLSPNTLYQVDLLANGGGRTQTIAYNGGAVADSQALADNTAYNFTNVVSSQADGTLVVNLAITAGFNNPVFSGLVVSSVPEPTALGLVGLGALGLMRRRRRMA